MLKAVFAVIAGYVVMALFVMVTSVVAFMAMGVDGAYRPGVFEPTTAWLVTVFALGLIAGMFGGYVCAMISRRPGAPIALAIMVFALGIGLALPVLRGIDPRPTIRTADVTAMQAMASGRQPPWVTLLMPIVGAAGVIWGAAVRKRRHPVAPARA